MDQLQIHCPNSIISIVINCIASKGSIAAQGSWNTDVPVLSLIKNPLVSLFLLESGQRREDQSTSKRESQNWDRRKEEWTPRWEKKSEAPRSVMVALQALTVRLRPKDGINELRTDGGCIDIFTFGAVPTGFPPILTFILSDRSRRSWSLTLRTSDVRQQWKRCFLRARRLTNRVSTRHSEP